MEVEVKQGFSVVLARELLEVPKQKLLVYGNPRVLLHLLFQVRDGLLVLATHVAANGWVLLPLPHRNEDLVAALGKLLDHVEHVQLARLGHLATCALDKVIIKKKGAKILIGGKLDKCLMFGDSENDADAAKAANIPMILLEDGYTDKKIEQIYHNHLISDFVNVEKIVSKYLHV